jgi:hypothetical protein
MKNVGLIGVSVAAAALIMAGCNSSSSGSGVNTPADLSKPAEMNISQARKAITLAKEGPFNINSMSSASTSQIASKLTAIQQAADVLHKGTYSTTYQCDVSGSYTVSGQWEYQYSSSYSGTWVASCQMNDCKTTGDALNNPEFYSYCVIPAFMALGGIGQTTAQTTLTLTGSNNVNWQTSYDADKNVSSSDITVKYNNFTVTMDDNESNNSMSLAANFSTSWKESGDGTHYLSSMPIMSRDSADKPSYSYLTNLSGKIKFVMTDGIHLEGYLLDGNLKATEDGLQDHTQFKDVINGYVAFYSMSGSESNTTMIVGYAWNNFTHSGTTAGSEDNDTYSGSVGSKCLGGSVAFTTNNTLQTNTNVYDNNESGSSYDTLPYEGNLTLKGTSSATVMFDSNESNYTTATVSASDVNETFGSWGSLYEYCNTPSIPLPLP